MNYFLLNIFCYFNYFYFAATLLATLNIIIRITRSENVFKYHCIIYNDNILSLYNMYAILLTSNFLLA